MPHFHTHTHIMCLLSLPPRTMMCLTFRGFIRKTSGWWLRIPSSSHLTIFHSSKTKNVLAATTSNNQKNHNQHQPFFLHHQPISPWVQSHSGLMISSDLPMNVAASRCICPMPKLSLTSPQPGPPQTQLSWLPFTCGWGQGNDRLGKKIDSLNGKKKTLGRHVKTLR